MTCAAKCGNASIKNGIVKATGSRIGDLESYKCDTGQLLQGSRYRVCLPGGKWSGGLPLCKGKFVFSCYSKKIL